MNLSNNFYTMVFIVERHWSHATTLWHYPKQTTLLMASDSLSDDEVSSLVP